MYSAVLVALDGSQAAVAAIPPALALAKALVTHLVLLQVLPTREVQEGPGWREHEALRFQAEGYLESLGRSLRTRGVKIECLVSSGDPASVILQTAQSLGEVLLVITAHGVSPANRNGELGRVATEVLRGAESSVLLVRPWSDRHS